MKWSNKEVETISKERAVELEEYKALVLAKHPYMEWDEVVFGYQMLQLTRMESAINRLEKLVESMSKETKE